MSFSGLQSVRACWTAHLLVALLCLTLAVQGGHVCWSGPHFESGVQSEAGSPPPVCPVCVVSHTLMFTVFFLLLFLMSGASSAVIPTAEAKKTSWREVRLYMRPPPAF